MKNNLPNDAARQAAHDAVYARRGLPPFNYSDIDGRIFAGRNPLTARDIDEIAALGVTHLLDLREAGEWKAPHFGLEAVEEAARLGLQRLHLPVLDMGAPTPQTLDAALQFIDETLQNPQAKVYIHCRAGMERTAAILIAHHARKHDLSYQESLKALRQRRPILRPLPNQERAVQQYLKA